MKYILPIIEIVVFIIMFGLITEVVDNYGSIDMLRDSVETLAIHKG